MVDRAAAWGTDMLRIPAAEARRLALDAATYVWEDCKFGRVVADTETDFWKLISRRLYDTRHSWRSRELSLDADIPNSDGGADGHDAGWFGYMPPDQIDVTYLNQIKGGICLLPPRQRKVMTMLSEGHTALDIANDLKLPIHTVFLIIRESRILLFDRDLIAMAREGVQRK